MSKDELDAISEQATALVGPGREEYIRLIQAALKSNVKITTEKVIRIWRKPDWVNIPGFTREILWVEVGTDKAGYQHMLKHKDDFEKLGVGEDKIVEIAEAATTVGVAGGMQGRDPGRPIFGLFFYGKPIAVAISVGSNGFIVGMNPSSFEKLLKEANITEDRVQEISSWPSSE